MKIIIRILHLYFFISPFGKSYKIGTKNNLPNFVFGKNLKSGFSVTKLIKESKVSNVIISGWGLRDWELVEKHKKKIIKYINTGLRNFIKKKSFLDKDYLLVHIRRSDFLEVNEYKDLNFNNKIWIKSISKLCRRYFIKDVVIFSDDKISKSFLNKLKEKGLNVLVPDTQINSTFFDLFFNFVYHASYVICNSSSLVLSISFISQENVYLPSKQKDFQKVSMSNAHNSFPTLLNWN